MYSTIRAIRGGSSSDTPICKRSLPIHTLLILLCFLRLVLFIRHSLWHDISEELEIINSCYRASDISILDVATLFALGFDDIVGLFDEVFEELFCCDCDGEGGVVGAVGDVVVYVDDLFDSRDWWGFG